MRQRTNPSRNAERVALREKKRGNHGQSPKFAKPRRHHPVHHAKDDNGMAITLVGREPRRIWLGGISAMRGF